MIPPTATNTSSVRSDIPPHCPDCESARHAEDEAGVEARDAREHDEDRRHHQRFREHLQPGADTVAPPEVGDARRFDNGGHDDEREGERADEQRGTLIETEVWIE